MVQEDHALTHRSDEEDRPVAAQWGALDFTERGNLDHAAFFSPCRASYSTGVSIPSAEERHSRYLRLVSPAELVKRARETGQPVVITQNGKATAVLQDVESFERQRHAMLLLKALVQGDIDYREGRSLTHGSARARVAKRLLANE